MKLKKINRFAEKRAKALYIYLQALWEHHQEKSYIQNPDYKKRQTAKIKKLRKKYEFLGKHYTKAIRKNAKSKYSTKITVDLNAFKALTIKHLYDDYLDDNQNVESYKIKNYYECEFSED